MKISKEGFDRFFEGVELRDVALPSTGEVFQMPLLGEKAVQMAAIFTASRPKVLDILPIGDFVPVLLPKERTLVAAVGIEYQKRNIPPYNEVLFVVPTFIGKDISPPTLEDMLKPDLGGATLFIRHIAVDTRMAMLLGNELLGYAKFIGDITFQDEPDGTRTCTLKDAGEEIFSFSVKPEASEFEYHRETMAVATYKNDKIYRLSYRTQSRRGVDMPPRGTIEFGPHPLGRILAGLDVSAQPIMILYSREFQLISDDRNLEVIEP
ncbi:MAG: hypothetical protein HPY75_09860 [Actinobacteria bacterium]|nr:hypothetical protein [Actinomycetota bacterium]